MRSQIVEWFNRAWNWISALWTETGWDLYREIDMEIKDQQEKIYLEIFMIY
jgi:hypothetical protein